MLSRITTLLLLLWTADSLAQDSEVYPSNWWVNMKWNQVQLLIRSPQKFKNEKVSVHYPGLSIKKLYKFANSKYLAVDLSISPEAKTGNPVFEITNNGRKEKITWPLKQRRKGNGTAYAQGVRSSDFIYLLMPDRFSNGDSTNDRIPGMRDQSLDRDSIFLRHGGDLQGVMDHLDYLQALGVTALWLTPVIENDMPNRTEHGYAFTNHYKIDPRLGGPRAYSALSDSLHKRGMKLIQDAVYNHMGLDNFLMQDPPSPDWVHQWPAFTRPNYKDQVHFDPYVSAKDRKQMVDGWFTPDMPDLNQRNPYVANFLIQHALWCVETFGVDGWRIDTYIYCDMPFMNRCNQALLTEYPRITMFGESWVEGKLNQAFFTRNKLAVPMKSNLPGTLDFQSTLHGIQPALTDTANGINQLYQTLGRDFVYENPMNNVIFLDNHDMSRIFSVVKENVKKQKMGIEWLLTERGIPQMYYGTEVLMKGYSNPDGLVRLDFPGGWPGDIKNGFTTAGMTADEISVQELTRKLANFRKNSSALKGGKLMHYVPQNGLYIYFRYDERETIMCVMNISRTVRVVNFNDYSERTSGFRKAYHVLLGTTLDTSSPAEIDPEEMWVLKLEN